MPNLTPEQRVRENIDAMLAASGWAVQTKDTLNLSASCGVAVCELSFATGEPDYALFVDDKAIGTVEAKPAGVTLTSAETQSEKYVAGAPSGLPVWRAPLPFCYESTGDETFFTNRLDPIPRSRRVFSFHRPETLLDWAQQEKQLSQRLCEFPPLSVVDELESAVSSNLQRAARLRQAVLQKAFKEGTLSSSGGNPHEPS